MRLDRRVFLGGALVPFLPSNARPLDDIVEAEIGVSDHRVTITAQLNGQGPFQMVIDTGAEVSGLRQSVADRLNLRSQRQIRLGGRPFPLFDVEDLVLGGAVRLPNAAFFGLGEAPGLGGDGLIAAGLITAHDTELSFETRRWRLHPSGLADRSPYRPIAGRLQPGQVGGVSSRLFGPVQVGGVELDVVWDTGAPHALSVPESVGRRLGLMDTDRPYAPIPSTGIHGLASRPARLLAAPRLQVGGEQFDGVRAIVRMDDDTAGATILGFPIMRCLDLALALADGGRFFGVRRNALQPVNLGYSLAGVWIDEARGGVRVSEVGTGSPGAEAGLRPGDVITNLGGFSSALTALRGPEGSSVRVTVSRHSRTESVELRLRDYLAG